MEPNGIDPRFPAVYQPGGEKVPPAATVSPAATVPPAASQEHGESRVGGGPDGRPAAVEIHLPGKEQTASIDATALQWPAWRWLVPATSSLMLLALGVFCLGAPYWIPSSLEMDPSKFHGINVPPWGQFINAPAPALLGSGLGILGCLLFLASRRNQAREAALRAAFGLMAVAVGVGGWLALFATLIFPQPLPAFGDYTNRGQPPLPLSVLLMPTGTWLLSLALFMAAALLVVPRRWQRLWPEDGAGGLVLADGGPSAGRGLLFGAVAAAAGLAALFAQYMFPLSTGVVTDTAAGGGTFTRPDWAALAPTLATPLMLAGLVVLGWACIRFAVASSRTGSDPSAELNGSGVELSEGWPSENWGGPAQ